MNLSSTLCARFGALGHEAVHWSSIGSAKAADEEIMTYAKDHACIVLTNDLAFGAILASTRADAPSVIQVRTGDLLSDRFVALVSSAIAQFECELAAGALIVIDERRSRVRVLPLG